MANAATSQARCAAGLAGVRSLEVVGPQPSAGVRGRLGIALGAIMWSQRSLVWSGLVSSRRAAWRRSSAGWPHLELCSTPACLVLRSFNRTTADGRAFVKCKVHNDIFACRHLGSLVAVSGRLRAGASAAESRCPGARHFFSRRPAERELPRAMWGTDRHRSRSYDGRAGSPSSHRRLRCREPRIVNHHRKQKWQQNSMEATR